jgi:uncharacterized protein (TIGR03382 family)
MKSTLVPGAGAMPAFREKEPRMNTGRIAMAVGVAAACAGASGDVVRGTITADNHYALYTSFGDEFGYLGGNETGPGGTVGAYNWSAAEDYAVEAGEFLYIAAWSDDRVAQGVLAEFYTDAMGTFLSGDERWRVYATNINRGNGDPHPFASEIGGHVAYADSNQLWESVVTGGRNGVTPWRTIAGIDSQAEWMWRGGSGAGDPLRSESGAGEMLLFRMRIGEIVPTPGSMAVLGVAGAILVRRRRR